MPSETPALTRGCAFYSHTPASIFIPEDFVGDERLMIDTAEQFSRKEVLPVLDRLEAQEEGLMPGLIRHAGELGFCGADAPEAYGGLGLGKNLAARILEFLSLNASFSVTLGVTSGVAQVALAWFGTDEQKSRYLPKLASGEWIGAYCLSEPNSGTDALSVLTRADRRNGKWVLNGTKMWISNAKWAQFFLVMAKVDGERLSAFLVERDFPGLSISREEHKLGLKASSTARLLMEDVEVPLENMLYEEGKGHVVALNSLNLGRFKLSSMSLGPARDAIGLAATYALDRKQFGQPIADFGLIQKKLALSAARFFAAESMTYRTGALIDEAFAAFGGSVAGNRKAAEEMSVECSACKVFATEAENFIIDEAMQVFGGYGFTEEFPIARHYRDARVSRIYEGTNEINRVFISDRLRRRAREGRASLTPAGDSFISELAGHVLAHAETAPAPTASWEQIRIGAASDLIILAYAEQSARLRAKRLGGLHEELYACFVNWANPAAAEAYQLATGSAVTLPSVRRVDWGEIAEMVYAKKAPL
ncbi:MAG TPA: acyl-CoA dehydrogenase family protein [Fimbriimonadaceae bacterium]|nr:acyl-CoA dehydrogenase family protein [Fimbriimonadaceae bacterium]